jgi:hypothetical protein
MFRRLLLVVFCCFCLVPALTVGAQNNPPPQLTNALADLSAQVGKTVTLADLQNWTFDQQNFPDSSLGCPKPGLAYSQIVTPGVQFMLTYGGKVYDYRVTLDGQNVILCSTTDAPETLPPCPPPDDPAYLAPRLAINAQGRVVPGGIPNNVREQPGTSAKKIGEIPPAAVFTVMDGPRCSTLDKIVWWKVNFNGLQGWTPEGQSGTYWIEPVDANGQPTVLATATPGAAGRTRLNTGNVSKATMQGSLTSSNGAAALSPSGQAIYVSQDGKIDLVNVSTGKVTSSANVPDAGKVTTFAFSAAGNVLVTGEAGGNAQVWDVGADGSLKARVTLVGGHTKPVTAAAFSPDGTLVVTGAADNTARVWDANSGTSLVQFTVNGPVSSISFNHDGDTVIIVSSAADGAADISLFALPAAAAG